MALVLSACSSEKMDTGVHPQPTEAESQASMMDVADPEPTGLTEVGLVGPDGGSAAGAGVSVQGAAGVVASGDSAVVSIGQSPGEVGGERWGVPVEVVHERPLSAPLTLTWDLEGVEDPDGAGLMLVRWDPSISAWVPQVVPYQVDGDTLRAEISDFSIWNWVINEAADFSARVGQEVGEVVGARVDEPTCEGDLPGWVRQVISPSEDLEAAAIGVCFEPDKDEVVTVRVSNNRTFTQVMVMTQGGQGWAWTWGGQEWVGIDQAAYGAARMVFDSDTHYLLPPLHEVSVGVARPGGGPRTISAEATVSTASVATDVVAYLLDQLPVGGLSNPVLNAAVQGVYACFGKQALGGGFASTDGLLRAVVDGLAGCADQAFAVGGSDFSDVVIDSMDNAKYVRTAQYFHGALRTLKFAEVAFYLSDQLANAAVGPLSWTIRGNGRAAPLGDWTATCNDLEADSNRLWRNLALRDEFADTSIDYHDFPGWGAAAEQAIAPIQACDPSYRTQLATRLTADWGHPQAARIVADLLDSPMTDALTYWEIPNPLGIPLDAAFSRSAVTVTGIESELEIPIGAGSVYLVRGLRWERWGTEEAIGIAEARYCSDYCEKWLPVRVYLSDRVGNVCGDAPAPASYSYTRYEIEGFQGAGREGPFEAAAIC